MAGTMLKSIEIVMEGCFTEWKMSLRSTDDPSNKQGEDVVEEVTMVSIKDLELVEVGPCCSLVKRREGQILSRVRPLMNPNKPRKNWKKEAKIF
jgi:hypothetical protein